MNVNVNVEDIRARLSLLRTPNKRNGFLHDICSLLEEIRADSMHSHKE
jgi:hypothetical protein